jgi:hypothetical protein
LGLGVGWFVGVTVCFRHAQSKAKAQTKPQRYLNVSFASTPFSSASLHLFINYKYTLLKKNNMSQALGMEFST